MFQLNKGWIFKFSIMSMLLVVLLAGCGNGNENQSNQAGNAANTAASSDDKGPARIVVTYFPYADHLFALGKADAVAGVVNLKSLQDFKVYEPFLKDGKIADLGSAIDYEQIMALKPDLIIASDADKDSIDELSKIARTVTVNATLNWQETIRGVAAAVGDEAAADTYISEFLTKQTDTAAELEKAGVTGKTALFMMPWEQSFSYWSGSRLAIYYEKLGFKPFEGLQNVGQISLEGIAELDPEYIFIGKDYTHASDISLEDLNKSAVWNSLSAVKNNKMFVVDTEILGPLAMGQFKGLEYMSDLFAAK
jgi:ABC-type Fe3+-hydroxamate transport system, periplasmic component